jgi:hypothetical protein
MCDNGVAGEEDERRGEQCRELKCWLRQSLVRCFFHFFQVCEFIFLKGNLLKPGNPYYGQSTDHLMDQMTN